MNGRTIFRLACLGTLATVFTVLAAENVLAVDCSVRLYPKNSAYVEIKLTCDRSLKNVNVPVSLYDSQGQRTVKRFPFTDRDFNMLMSGKEYIRYFPHRVPNAERVELAKAPDYQVVTGVYFYSLQKGPIVIGRVPPDAR
jgi:hypothetical protein